MSVLEKKHVQDPTIRWAKEHGILCIRFTPFGERGWPDHILLLPSGKTLWVEFKAPGEEPEPLQAYRHRQLRTYRQTVYVFDTAAIGIQTLQAELEPPRISKEGDD